MLDATPQTFDRLPHSPGVGYKPQHYADILRDPAPVQMAGAQ